MLTNWMTSMVAFSPLVMPILEKVNPQRICEIGAAAGGHTKMLYDFLKLRDGELLTIDPFPRGTFLQWVRESSPVVTHLADYSLNVLHKVSHADVWFVDGDHNWYTVFHELALINHVAEKSQRPALIFLHDVSWPCARRDMYYDPKIIPAEYVHPHSNELGITLHKAESVKNGFRGPNWALLEGGPRNGVLTAVEDFIQSAANAFHWVHVPAVLGLGVLIDKRHPLADEIMALLAPYHNNPIMALLELDRITHYLQVVALNDKLVNVASAMCAE